MRSHLRYSRSFKCSDSPWASYRARGLRSVLVAFLLIGSLLGEGLSFAAARSDASGSSGGTERGTAGSLRILRITPSGEDVPAGQEIVFQFDRPMVPLGRMERGSSEVPIRIEPAPACQWRWLNLSTLACRLDAKDALTPATRYRITVSHGIKAEDGAMLDNEVIHTFITERPSVAGNWFKTWLSAGTPQIGIRFNQAVFEASVAKHLYFRTQRGVRVGVKLSPDPDNAAPGDASEEPVEGEHKAASSKPAGHTGETGKTSKASRAGLVWLVTPTKELPQGEEISLRMEAGVASTKGPEASAGDRSLVSFHTFPNFRFLGVECRTNQGALITILSDTPSEAKRRCNPIQGASLVFSSPVIKEEVQQSVHITPDLAAGRSDYDPWADVYTESHLSEAHQKGKVYTVPLPDGALKAFKEYRIQAAPQTLKDEFGRPLPQAIDLRFAMDHQPPDFLLIKRWPVLEKGLDTDVPMLATNLERVDLKFESLTAQGKTPQGARTINVPKAQDTTIAVPLGIRQMIPAASGAVQGQLKTQPAVPDKKSEASFLAQITPFHVHIKLGHQNILAWITDLQSGAPVPDVEVQVYKDTYNGLGSNPEILSRAKTREDGLAELPGTARLDPELKLINSYKPEEPHLFIRCLKAGDMAMMPVKYDFEVSAEGANHEYIPGWTRHIHGHLHSWGATAQGIYKVGDTVQYKIYVRDQDNRRFVLPPDSDYRLKVMDPMDKVVYERESIKLSAFGAFDGEFVIPKTGAVGWYRFELKSSFSNEEWEPMRVLVSDFTPSPFKVTTDVKGELFGAGDTVKVGTQAKLHAGGPFTNAPVRITAFVEARPFTPQDPKARGFEFDVLGESEHRTPESHTLYQTNGKLDDSGAFETSFEITQTPVLYGRLTVESAVRDDRGKSVAARASAAFVGRERYVGLAQEDWILEEGKPAKIRALVVDRNGHPAAGTTIRLTVERQETKASRVKGAGDAYLTQYVEEWVAVEKLERVSSLDPQEFEFTPKLPGTFKITAKIDEEGGAKEKTPSEAGAGANASTSAGADQPASETESAGEGADENKEASGKGHETSIQRYVTGRRHVLWESIPGNLLNVYGEKQEYKVGETARFFVQNPFPGARALITVERLGVMQKWVKTFESSTEIVEIPVLPDYLPGFYVSIMVMSPRVEKPLGPDGADLGKPTFRMGYVKVPVVDPYKEIAVRIRTGQEVYKPRDTVTVELQASPRNPTPGEPAPPIELAVAVLDDSVFDLLSKGKEAYDPYRGFYRLDDLDLVNYNLIMHLVGREKLEKKGANPGGGGGPDLGMRSVFKFLSYWNPSLRVDAEGKAKIQFQAPDNLTGWRVLVMAVTPDDLMGLGDTVFRVNQSTEIRPILPNQVTEGDSFEAGFSIMNRTDATRTLDVAVEASGPVEADTEGKGMDEGKDTGKDKTDVQSEAASPEASLPLGRNARKMTWKITAEPYKRYTVRLPIKTAGSGEIAFTARAGDERDRDAMKHTLTVQMRLSPETAATYGTTTAKEIVEAISFPQDMREDSGRVAITASPTIIGSLEGAFEFMRDYPYTCWEQQITRAVMAAWYQTLKPYVAGTFSWEESVNAPTRMLALALEHQAPNGGMTYYVPKDEYADPYLSAFTALAFHWLRTSGHNPPRQVEARLHEYLQTLLRKNVVPDFYTSGMTWTVRAAALAALAEQGKVSRADIERYSSHVPEMSLMGKALYLQALLKVDGTVKLRRDVLTTILAHSDESGGTFIFSEPLDLRYQQILASPLRDNCAILSALLAYQAASSSDTSLGDIPLRLMRTITLSRKGRSHWPSTQESIFAVKALSDFSRIYEAQPPDMTVQASMDKEPLGQVKLTSFTDPAASFERPIRPGDQGRNTSVRIKRAGEGRLYYSTSLTYAPARLKTEAIDAGIEVHREYSVERNGQWVLLQSSTAESPMEVKTGELARVDLYVSVPAARHFVVAEDPVPGGLEPVSRSLATASTVDAAKAEPHYPEGSFHHRFGDWLEYALSRWSFYHKELRHSAVRFYSEYLPPGRYHLSYVAQVVAPGRFVALPFHAEEMYNPDVFGKGAPAALNVKAEE